jgi:hypothetical protein
MMAGRRARVAASRRRSTRSGGRCRASLAPLLAVVALAGPGALPAGAQPQGRILYQWSDADGVVRFTTSPDVIPSSQRSTMQPVEPGRSAEHNATLLPGARTAFEPEDPSVQWFTEGLPGGESDPFNAAVEALRVRSSSSEIAELDQRIVELEIAIARDEEEVKLLISDPAGAPELSSSERLAEIGERLPERQAELRSLRARRASLSGEDAP